MSMVCINYDRESDGTLKYINLYKDESAVPHLSYVYRWNAAPGTAGTWPYHDHNMENHNGAEDKGLFGALIVRSAAEARQAKTSSNRAHVSPNVAKDYVFYLGDDAFWAMKIDNATGKQTALGTNSTECKLDKFIKQIALKCQNSIIHVPLSSIGWGSFVISPARYRAIFIEPKKVRGMPG